MSKKSKKIKDISPIPNQKQFKDGLNAIWKTMRSGIHVAQVGQGEREKILKSLFFKLYMPSVNEEYRSGSYMDLFPQVLSIDIATASLNTFNDKEIPLAINRLSVNEGKAWVIEICRILWTCDEGVFDLSNAHQAIEIQLSTKELPAIDFPDSTVFWFGRIGATSKLVGAAGLGSHSFPTSRNDDLTSEGRGFLVGSDSIFVGIDTTGLPDVTTVPLKCYYRFREVGLAEYVGIVQGEED